MKMRSLICAASMAAATRSACTVSAHVVHAHDRRALFDREQMGGDGAADALGQAPTGMTALMKRLREAPTRSGRPKRLNSASRARQTMLCSGVLPKPMPGSSTIFSRAMPARAAISSERAKKAITSATMSMLRRRVSRLCMTITGTPRLRDQRRHVGIALQAPDVVDDRRAMIERPGGDPGFDGVDRERQAELHDLRQYRLEPRQFVVGRDRLGAAIGPRRLRADIENVGALLSHFPGMGDGASGVEKLAAVGEGIRRDIEMPITKGRPVENSADREFCAGFGAVATGMFRLRTLPMSIALRGRWGAVKQPSRHQ